MIVLFMDHRVQNSNLAKMNSSSDCREKYLKLVYLKLSHFCLKYA